MFSGFKKRVLALCLIGCLLVGLLTFFAPTLLFVESKGARADAIVVLGGEAGDRTFRAVEIFKSGAAPLIVVTGNGDCDLIRDRILLTGVSSDRVIVEENSRSTKENAEFSLKLLRQHGCKKVILVTSWYHSRRALACFKHYGKDMEFFSVPAYHGINMEHKPSLAESTLVLHEYIGLVWYSVRNGIFPF